MNTASRKEVAAQYEQAWPLLYRFIYRRVQNREEAQDLTQEALARSWARLHREGHPASILPYVQSVALNLIRDRWRRRARRMEITTAEEVLLQNPPGTASAWGDETDHETTRIWLRQLLAELPPDYRTVLELRIIQGYSRQETARKMGRSVDAVRGMQYRALQAMRELVEKKAPEVMGRAGASK